VVVEIELEVDLKKEEGKRERSGNKRRSRLFQMKPAAPNPSPSMFK